MQMWDKQNTESKQEFAVFTMYRDNSEYRELSLLSKITNKNKSQITKWIGKHNWAERTDKFDKFIQYKNSTSSVNINICELKQTIDKLQSTLKDKINEQFEGIESTKIDDLIKLITNLNKLASDLEKNQNQEYSQIDNEYIKNIRENPKAMKAFYEFIKISEMDN
jgi:hypothetical protein